MSKLMCVLSIVEYSNQDDARKAKDELADKAFMGRSVFIREVSPTSAACYHVDSRPIQDREETARFGAAPIPGKIGLAMGESRHFLGQNQQQNAVPNRNLFVGNVSANLSDLLQDT